MGTRASTRTPNRASRLVLYLCLLFLGVTGALLLFAPPDTAQAQAQAETAPSRYWPTGPVLDQLDTPECVAYSLAGWLEAGPDPFTRHPSPDLIYMGAQARDPWRDKPHEGSTIAAGIDYLFDYGYVDSVSYTSDVNYVESYILTTGPAEMSTIWTYNMSQPDATGRIRPTDLLYAFHQFHAWFCYAYDGNTDSFWCQNSWGQPFGNNGKFRITKSDMNLLLTDTDLAPGNREAGLAHKTHSKWLRFLQGMDS